VGTGTADLSAVDLGKTILLNAGNNLHSLGTLTVKDLVRIRGIGEAKAVSIVAALELGRRRKDIIPDEKPKITGSKVLSSFCGRISQIFLTKNSGCFC
jgi:DNA repair protein RadC